MFKSIRQRLKKEGVPAERWREDSHWNWSNKISVTRGCLAYESYCIKAGGSLEGLMLLNTAGQSRIRRGQEVIYIEFLATAPWNRKEISAPRRYAGVGEVLMEAAIRLSLEYELGGRIALHSLPGAAGFYRNILKMTDLGPDPDPRHQNLSYFEMTEEQARDFLHC